MLKNPKFWMSIYSNYLYNGISDNANAASPFNNKSTEYTEKAFYILTRPWCFAIILLLILIIATSNILSIFLMIKHQNAVIVIGRGDSGDSYASDFKLVRKSLGLPIQRNILTTDRSDSCCDTVCRSKQVSNGKNIFYCRIFMPKSHQASL